MRIVLLLMLVPAVASAELRMGRYSALPSIGVGVGVGYNTLSARVEAPVTLFAGFALVPELSNSDIRALGAELLANLLFSGDRPVTFEPVLSALLELKAGPTLTLGAGPTVVLTRSGIDGAVISASFGSRALARVQTDVRVGASQPRVDVSVRFDVVGVVVLVGELFKVFRRD